VSINPVKYSFGDGCKEVKVFITFEKWNQPLNAKLVVLSESEDSTVKEWVKKHAEGFG